MAVNVQSKYACLVRTKPDRLSLGSGLTIRLAPLSLEMLESLKVTDPYLARACRTTPVYPKEPGQKYCSGPWMQIQVWQYESHRLA